MFSSTKKYAPSPSTNPSRSLLNGREARCGAWFHDGVITFITQNPSMMLWASGASTPPVKTVLIRPITMFCAAYEIASVEDVQPVEIKWLKPFSPKGIDNSLGKDPGVAVGML